MINGGTTVLYVSHSLESVKKLCNRAIWLDHGSIKQIGNAAEICDSYVRAFT